MRTNFIGTVEERLYHYRPEGAPHDCWEWQGTKSGDYGVIAVAASKHRGAHVVAWEIANHRRVPKGRHVMHRCDNPPCCNPAHLELGDVVKNTADRDKKGRQARGERQHLAKLTAADVLQIRRLLRNGAALREVSVKFGVSEANISQIRLRHTWKHLPEEVSA